MKSQQSTRSAWTLTLLLFCSHTCVATSGGWHDVIIIHQLHSLSPSFRMRRPKMVRCGEHWRIVCWDLLSTPPCRKAWTTHHDPSNRPDAAAPDPGASRPRPDIFLKIAVASEEIYRFQHAKKHPKTSRPGFGKSICAICLQDASYSCEDKINMQLILTHAFCTDRFQKGTEKRKNAATLRPIHCIQWHTILLAYSVFKHAFSRRPSVKHFQFLGSAPAMSLEDLEVQIPQVDQAGPWQLMKHDETSPQSQELSFWNRFGVTSRESTTTKKGKTTDSKYQWYSSHYCHCPDPKGFRLSCLANEQRRGQSLSWESCLPTPQNVLCVKFSPWVLWSRQEKLENVTTAILNNHNFAQSGKSHWNGTNHGFRIIKVIS